jgi:hypothetical protein
MPFIVDGTNGGFFPSWTTATRPASPAVGQMGYNTTIGQFDAYTSGGWVSVLNSGSPQSQLPANIAGNGPAFSAYQVNGNANQNISSDVFTKANIDTELFDTASCFNTSTNRFTPNIAGYYQVNGTLYLRNAAACALKIIALYKNGSLYQQGMQLYFTGNFYIAADCFSVSTILYMNGTTDYIELYAYISSSAASIGFGSSVSYFNAALVRGA